MNSAASSVPLPVFHQIPGGDAGVATTVRFMRRFALEGAAQPGVARVAERVVDTARRSPFEEFAAVHEWVRDGVLNVPDPAGVEWLQAPAVTLLDPRGDCDDKAALAASLLLALGFCVRFVVIAANPRRPRVFSHVYLEALVPALVPGEPALWVASDPKVPGAWAGWAFPSPFRVMRSQPMVVR